MDAEQTIGGKKKPKPYRILFRFFSLGLLFIWGFLSWIIMYFLNFSGRFATDSYIQINVVLGIYKNNC